MLQCLFTKHFRKFASKLARIWPLSASYPRLVNNVYTQVWNFVFFFSHSHILLFGPLLIEQARFAFRYFATRHHVVTECDPFPSEFTAKETFATTHSAGMNFYSISF